MRNKYLPYAIGGGLLLLAMRAKSKYSARQIQVAETIAISRQGRTIANHLSRLGGEETSQLNTLRNVIADPAIQGVSFGRNGRHAAFVRDTGGRHIDYIGASPLMCKCGHPERHAKAVGAVALSRDGRPKPHIVYGLGGRIGALPFDFQANPPTPMEVAILYSIEPNFLIKGPGIYEQTVAQLLPFALEIQPNIKAFAQEKNPAQLIENGISILSLRQLRVFALDVAENIIAQTGGKLGDAAPYAGYLAGLQRMMAYKAANGPIVNFREPAAQRLKQEILTSLEQMGLSAEYVTDAGIVKPSITKRPLVNTKKPAIAQDVDQMMASLYNLVWASDPFATVQSNQSAALRVLKDSQSVARHTYLMKSNWLARTVKWRGYVSAEYRAASALPRSAQPVYRSTAEVISDRIFKGRQPNDVLNEMPSPAKPPTLTPLTRGEELQGQDIWNRLKRAVRDME